MKCRALLFQLMLSIPFGCQAQHVSAAKEFTFEDLFAYRKENAGSRAYILLGSGWLRGISANDPGQFIAHWLVAHPSALIRPVSRMGMTNTRTKLTAELVYIWAEDGENNLNVDLIRAGIFPAGVMADMVDNDNGLTKLLNGPELASSKALIEKERAERPQDRPRRLISEDLYQKFCERIEAAERQARTDKLGIWSDEMKEERESAGLPP